MTERRLAGIELTADWLMKKRARRLREERRVQQELTTERGRLDRERAHLLNALSSLQGSGGHGPDLQARLVPDGGQHHLERARLTARAPTPEKIPLDKVLPLQRLR